MAVSQAEADDGAGNQPLVRLAKATSESITGTSMSTPTTVASAAVEVRPKRLMATATASSKKLEVPIIAAGAATLNGSLSARARPRSEEHTSELQSRGHLVCRLLLEKKKEQL